ncbi:MAG: ribose 5-phosphate isomerase A [Candidatus Heimdallarchaeota archaeon]|nr:ribose 5-phosphate isomerase A [Candidatus Heimdallarchaeota archaeon]
MKNHKLQQEKKIKLATYIRDKLISNIPIIAFGSGTTVNTIIDQLNPMNPTRYLSGSTSTTVKLAECNLEEIILDSVIGNPFLLIDGADYVDFGRKQLIKGYGGALFREKILWSNASQIFLTVDDSKIVNQINDRIPIEILPFARKAVYNKLKNLHLIKDIKLKKNDNQTPYITDNSNLIFEVYLKNPLLDMQELDSLLKSIPGVIETGLFYGDVLNNCTVFVSSDKGIDEVKFQN